MIRFRSIQNIKVDSARIESLIDEIRHDPMGGWFDLPLQSRSEELSAIKSAAQTIQSNSEYLVCVGIGGSYLGHRAIIEALRPTSSTKILYAGNSLSSREFAQLLDTIGDSDFSVNVISKSGTTTEPAVAFRLLKAKLVEKYGDHAHERIYATTDSSRGALHDEAVAEGYTRFIVPDDIGGRYSVLSAVGLLPLAVAGVDIDALIRGAASERNCVDKFAPEKNSSVLYATARAELLQRGYDLEILASFEPCLRYFTEWWKQLFGESEGKQHQGIFPASVIYTTDLHSLGQYIQDGRRDIFETVLKFRDAAHSDLIVPHLSENLDGLQYVEGKSLNYLNQTALDATISAHRDGGIPVFEIEASSSIDAHTLGELIFFFEFACAVSAKLVGVNPFDQPGVEAYKKNMFHLLGKPGF